MGKSAPAPSSAPTAAMTVSPAPETSYTSRATAGNVERAVRREEAHAFLGARDEQRRDVERLAQRHRLGGHLARIAPATHHLPEFAAIGRDHRRAAIAVPVLALGVDQHGLARRARALDHRRDVREPALAVVGEDEEVRVGEQAFEVGQLGRQHLVRGRGLEIDAQQLLLARDDAHLDGRGQRRVAVKRRLHAVGREQALERGAGLVGAGDRQQRGPRAQRRRVARDVGRSAGALLGALDPDDGHGRLRRDPLDVAEPVAVEHHVARDQEPRARDPLAPCRESGAHANGDRSRSIRVRRRAPAPGRRGCGRRTRAAT